MTKYSKTPSQLNKGRTLVYLSGDYPTLSIKTIKKDGRIIDNGVNFICHFADGSAAIPCRKLKDALLYVNLVSTDKMPASYRTSLK